MHKTRRTLTFLAVALSASIGAGNARASGFLFGAYTGMKVDLFETMIGHTIKLDLHFQYFGDPLKSGILLDIPAGRTPMVSWSSTTDVKGDSVLASDILKGVYDSQLQALAQAYAALGGTVLLEWQPEMTDNPRNTKFMGGLPFTQQGPVYVAVWQHIHDIFVAAGATNVQWVWSPGGRSYETRWNGTIKCQPFFPGVSYVDWMGLHSYNKTITPMAYDANPELLAFYAQAPSWAPGKPLIHSQTAGINTNNAQYEWLSTAESDLQSEFPLIRAFVYENGGKYVLGGQGLSAYSTMAADPYFQY